VRDPLASNLTTATEIHRQLYHELPQDHFLYSSLSRELVACEELLEFSFSGAREIVSPRIPFVSYPDEWCNAQLIDAADLTLTVSEKVLPARVEIKDASAWNIIFDGCRPIFCDHLSFQAIESKRWWAFGQYIRHFILPLCLAKYCDFEARNSFKIARDGVTPEFARNLIGTKRFLTRYWLLMLESWANHGSTGQKSPVKGLQTHHKNLYAITRWFLKGVALSRLRQSTWLGYTEDRSHYSEAALHVKYKSVKAWLQKLAPTWVIDIGCNTGEFSKLAVSCGSKVVAIDSDYESIQILYLSSKGQPVYPVVANLEDLQGGRGWSGEEFPGLLTRLNGHADMLLMLAVIHHLAISSSIPYERIANLAARMTKTYVIAELLSENDQLVIHLAKQRNRDPREFTLQKQMEAFRHHFEIVEQIPLPGLTRNLVLMAKLN
jgi:SAM-dependent methyltransferase